MARNLDFNQLDLDNEAEARAPEPRSWRRNRRDANPTVQMSVRMKEDVYESFRSLCAFERRTNGDMLEVLMRAYKAQSKKEGETR